MKKKCSLGNRTLYFLKNVFLIFLKMELSCLKNKKLLKKCLIFWEMEFLATSLKNFLYFRGILKKKSSNFLFVERKLVKHKYQTKKFLIILSYNYNNAFFLLHIFFYTQQAFAFHLLVDFCIVNDHIVTFFLFLP